MFPWLEIAGWVGSALVVLSLTQARVFRFRWLNLTGSLIATTYNAILGIWPFFAMNAAISLINIYWLRRLTRERHDAAVYEVVEVAPDDAYLLHVLRTHAADIAGFAPGFVAQLGRELAQPGLQPQGHQRVGCRLLAGQEGPAHGVSPPRRRRGRGTSPA